MKRLVCLLFTLMLCLTVFPAGAAAEGSASASAKYVDFDDMSFWINGRKFTLGVSTLQDMIDAGVAFREEDLEDANNNLRKNLQSESFYFSISAHAYATVKVMNDTDKGKRLADCVLSRIYVTFSDHHEEKKDSALSFAFPLDMTKEQLEENAGEPNDKNRYEGSRYVSDTYEYKKTGKRYYGYNKYCFIFYDDVLDYFYIEYLP